MMNNNNVVRNEVRNFSLVCREGKALLLNNTTGKYSTLTDDNGSTTMAAIKMLADLVGRMEQTPNILNIVFIPRNLGGILKLDAVDSWIANGNKTDKGVQLSDEYVELAKYITDMRKWLGTNNLVLKIQGGNLMRDYEKKMVDTAWRAMDKVVAKKPVYTRPADNNVIRPVKPNAVQAVQVDNIEF